MRIFNFSPGPAMLPPEETPEAVMPLRSACKAGFFAALANTPPSRMAAARRRN